MRLFGSIVVLPFICLNLLGVLPLLAVAQVAPVMPLRVTRPGIERLELEFKDDLPAKPHGLKLFLPGAVIKDIDHTQINVGANKITINLPQDIVKSIDELRGQNRDSRLYIPLQEIGAVKIAEAMLVIPAGIGFSLNDPPPLSEGHILPVKVVFCNPALEKILLKEESWLIGKKEDKIVANPAPGQSSEQNGCSIQTVKLTLQNLPSDGDPISISFDTGTEILKLGKFALPAGPQKTKTSKQGTGDAYLGFQVTASDGKAPVFGVELLGSYKLKEDLVGRTYKRFGPTWRIQANSSQQDNENVLHLGFDFEAEHYVSTERSSRWPRTIGFFATPKFENDQRFKNSNFVVDGTMRFYLGPFSHLLGKDNQADLGADKEKRVAFKPTLQIGFELGKNLLNEIKQLEGDPIRRLTGSADFEAKFKINGQNLKHVILQLGYEHYQLFKEERFTKTVAEEIEESDAPPPDGNVLSQRTLLERTLLVSRRKGPRNYFTAKLLFGLNDKFDLDFTYSYGELPPTFQQVNKFQAGFGYRFNLRRQ